MIKAVDLVSLFWKALNEKWGYIWGRWGQTWTAASQAAATRPMTVAHGSKWIGRRVADCSGLFRWAFTELGGSIYHGSDTIWRQYCAAQGKLINGQRDDGFELRPGTAVFMYNKKDGKRGHIGLYIGGGLVIEAKGTKDGVVISKAERWHEWGELKGVIYAGDPIKTEGVMKMATVRRGDRGASVIELQKQLENAGYEVGKIDGIFGDRTLGAVQAFQRDNGLKVDGIAGKKTWAALEKATAKTDVPDTNVEQAEETQNPPVGIEAGFATVLTESTVTLTLPKNAAIQLYEALKGGVSNI